MSEYMIVCPECGNEILNTDSVQRTPTGRVVCEECARENYTDVPLS